MADQSGTNLPLLTEEAGLRKLQDENPLVLADPPQRPLTFRTVLDLFARQHVSMALIMAIALTLGVVAIIVTPPIYQSVTEILVEGRTQNSPGQNPNDPITQVSLPNAETDIITQMQVLQSSKLQSEAYALANVNFTAADVEAGLAPHVSVEQVGATSVLQIRVESASPQAAQSLAIALPQVYLGYVKTTRQGEASSAQDALEKRLSNEQAAFDKAERELQAFKDSRLLIPLASEPGLRSQALTSMEADAARTQAAVAGAQERLDSLVQQRAILPQLLSDNAKQANSKQIEEQKGLIANLKAQRDALLINKLPNHPDVLAMDAQIRAAEVRLTEIPKELDLSVSSNHPELLRLEQRIADARSELRAARAQSSGIDRALGQAKAALEDYYKVEPRQNELTRAVEDSRATILDIRRSLDELRVRSSAVKDPVTVLTPATSPSKVRPNEVQYIGVSLLAGLFFAIAFAAIKDGLEEKVVSLEEVAREARLEPLGAVAVSKRRNRPTPPDRLNEVVLEQYRQLRHRISLANNGPLGGIVSIVGVGAGHEGVAELASNLAIGFADQQREVILVNADLRSSDLVPWFKLTDGPGLTDLINGDASLDATLQKTTHPHLRVLTAGSPVTNPTDLLSTDAATRVLQRLRSEADLVFVLCPGFTSSADAEVITANSDAQLLVVGLLSTNRRSFTRALLPMQRSGAHAIGVVGTEQMSKSRMRSK